MSRERLEAALGSLMANVRPFPGGEVEASSDDVDRLIAASGPILLLATGLREEVADPVDREHVELPSIVAGVVVNFFGRCDSRVVGRIAVQLADSGLVVEVRFGDAVALLGYLEPATGLLEKLERAHCEAAGDVMVFPEAWIDEIAAVVLGCP